VILKDELKSNSQLTKDYLNLPLCKNPMPEPTPYEPPLNFTIMSNLQKAKHHLTDMAYKNQKKVKEAMEFELKE
jgi:hypothetical protein